MKLYLLFVIAFFISSQNLSAHLPAGSTPGNSASISQQDYQEIKPKNKKKSGYGLRFRNFNKKAIFTIIIAAAGFAMPGGYVLGLFVLVSLLAGPSAVVFVSLIYLFLIGLLLRPQYKKIDARWIRD